MHLSVPRSAALSLALLAMLLRALLPDGWMPNAGGDAAASPFVICSVDGAHRGKAPADPQQRGHAPCAFAAAAPLSPPLLAAVALPAPSRHVHVARSDLDHAAPSTSSHRPNAPRAPPAFS